MLLKNTKTNNYIFEYDYLSKYSYINGKSRKREIKITKINNETNELYFTLTTKFIFFVKILNQLKEKENFKEVINRPFILSLLDLSPTSYSHNFTELNKSNFLEFNKSGVKDSLILGKNSLKLLESINKNNELKKLYLDLRKKIEIMYNKETKEFKSLMQIQRENKIEENKKIKKEIFNLFKDGVSLN